MQSCFIQCTDTALPFNMHILTRQLLCQLINEWFHLGGQYRENIRIYLSLLTLIYREDVSKITLSRANRILFFSLFSPFSFSFFGSTSTFLKPPAGLRWWAILLDFFTRYITNLCPKRRRYRKIVSGVSSVQQNSKRFCYTVHNKWCRYRKIESGVSSVQQNSKRCVRHR